MEWRTHDVVNQTPELQDYNIFSQDEALVHATGHFGADWQLDTLSDAGANLGRASILQLGELANKHLPELKTHDRIGQRIDLVEFHPSWHELLATSYNLKLNQAPCVQRP